MSHDHAAPHTASNADLEDSFTNPEWSEFRKADVKAGTAIVALMLSIFCTGIVLYTIVVITL
ncbi:MAG: hypothetical protein HY040_03350 [Planctomycetes bacterium]|nr:hypothetical protein [Planctomycetota bacterium]